MKQSLINRAIGPLREILLSHSSGPTMESVIQKFQKRKNHQDRNEEEVALMGRVVELQGAHQDSEDPELEVNYQACRSPIPGVRREEEYPSRERHRQREECPSKDASKRRQRPGSSWDPQERTQRMTVELMLQQTEDLFLKLTFWLICIFPFLQPDHRSGRFSRIDCESMLLCDFTG